MTDIAQSVAAWAHSKHIPLWLKMLLVPESPSTNESQNLPRLECPPRDLNFRGYYLQVQFLLNDHTFI